MTPVPLSSQLPPSQKATGGPHLPSAPHVSMPLAVHWVAPGVHEPVHTPCTHAWFVQGTANPQTPLVLHVCTPLPEHCVVPGVQTPQ
jgi:hypothetical protein